MVLGSGAFTGATEPTDVQLLFFYLAMFAGPAIAGLLLTGVFEELSWTGFAVPRLRLRHGVVATGIIVGLSRRPLQRRMA